MKIAVYGRSGQVATELQRRAPGEVDLLGRDRANFLKPVSVYEATRALKVDAIINAAAYTAVDKAETDRSAATNVNATSVAALGKAAAEIGVPIVHISTDYVFPGSGSTPWKPDDPTGPLGFYGQSKLEGETGLIDSGAHHAILRTSWVFSAHGGNFVKTMLRLGKEQDRLSVVNDQIGGPTPAAAIADACLTVACGLVDGAKGGTYHFSGAPDVSWADFARAIFAETPLSPKVIEIASSERPTPAARPMNSRLDCTSLKQDFDISRPDWRAGLVEVLGDLHSLPVAAKTG